MSSPNREPSETMLLLGDSGSPPAGGPSKGRRRVLAQLSPETLLVPVALATRLAFLLPSTTLIELVRQVVCKTWQTYHGDPITLPTGPSPDICDAPEVEQYFSMAVAALGITEGLLTIAGCGLLSRYSSRVGRKPAISFALAAGALGGLGITGSQSVPDWLSDWFFLVGLLLQLFSGAGIYIYLVNAYVVDVCSAEERTAALSKITGWAMIGACISFAVGGFVTTKTGNRAIVFYMSTAVYLATLVYVTFILPESFSEEKREALVRMQLDQSIQESTQESLAKSFLRALEPLKLLIPRRNSDGSRNWRLALCALHMLVVTTANAFMSVAWVVVVTSKYHLTPAQTGLFLTVVTTSGAVTLTVVVPPLVGFLRPYYQRKKIPCALSAEDPLSDVLGSGSGTSDRLDVHLTFATWVIAGISFVFAARSTTSLQLILSGICIGFSVVHTPTLRSLVAGSVDPLKQGETLAAIEMVSSVGICLSTTLMGAILTATIATAPLTIFYVHMVFVILGAALSFFVKDADRFQKPLDG